MANLTKDEPVISGGAGLGVVASLLAFLTTSGAISDVQASATTQFIASFMALIGPVGVAYLVRFRTYAAHKVEAVIATSGLITEADVANIVQSVLDGLTAGDVEHPTGADHPDAERVGVPVVDSMSAGTPTDDAPHPSPGPSVHVPVHASND